MGYKASDTVESEIVKKIDSKVSQNPKKALNVTEYYSLPKSSPLSQIPGIANKSDYLTKSQIKSILDDYYSKEKLISVNPLQIKINQCLSKCVIKQSEQKTVDYLERYYWFNSKGCNFGSLCRKNDTFLSI